MSLPRQQNGGGLQGGPSGWERDPRPSSARRLGGDPHNPEWGQARPSPGLGAEPPGQSAPRAPGPAVRRLRAGPEPAFGSCVFKRWLAPGCSCCFCAIETVEIHYS